MREPARWIARLALVGLAGLGAGPGGVAAQEPTRALLPEGEAVRRLQVGPQRAIRSIGEAARQLKGRAGVVEVDAGSYPSDVAVWEGSDVLVRAVGGRVRLLATGEAAEGKGIWVVRDSRMKVEGFDFVGARVPDANGAGIRFESGRLQVRDCMFLWNENGILTGNDERSELEIEDSVFGHNGHGDGQSHNLYVGAIASLKVTGSWFHHANVGHLLKSRAARSLVLYNRLSDGPGGRASYELEFPAGGVAVVMGNLLQQSATTENSHLIAYGAEGYRWSDNRLVLVHNTLVDERPGGGIPLRVRPGAQPVLALNNLIVGSRTELSEAGPGDYRGNPRARPSDFAPGPDRWRLRGDSRLATMRVDAGRIEDLALAPEREYLEPVGTRPRHERLASPGALAPAKP